MTREILIKEIKEKALQLKRTPGRRDFTNSQQYQICKIFGSHNNLVLEAGLTPLKNRGITSNENYWIEIIKLKYIELNRIPTLLDIENDKSISSSINASTKTKWTEWCNKALGKHNYKGQINKYIHQNNSDLILKIFREIKRLELTGIVTSVRWKLERDKNVPTFNYIRKRFNISSWYEFINMYEKNKNKI